MTDQNQNETPKNEAPRQDWNKLAQEALDLWQNHLTALATDASAKDEMSRFVAPMSQMFSSWTTMMQQGMASVMPENTTKETASEPTTTGQPQETENPENIAEPTVAPDEAKVDFPYAPVKEEGESLVAPIQSASTEQRSELRPELRPEPKTEPRARPRALATDGTGDLAELAGRLAKLERELETLRARPKRHAGDIGALAGENADAQPAATGNVQRVAGSGST